MLLLLLLPFLPFARTLASWEELDDLETPAWYDQAKIGIFIHWGVFSVPSYGSEWFWQYWNNNSTDYVNYVKNTEAPGFTYAEYATRFTAELFDPVEWASLFASSGAQYVVLTSKHHEGFCDWPSNTSWNWNSVDLPPHRDLVGDLGSAIRNQTSPLTKRSLKYGLYHSLFEWFNPLFKLDQANNFTTDHFVQAKTLPELYDLVNRYEPDLIWSDGDWMIKSDYWKAVEFLSYYHNRVPNAVWNDRWGKDATCVHGSFVTCSDRYLPDTLLGRKFENAFTIDRTSWGWNRKSQTFLTSKDIIHTMIKTVAFNGNVNINIGPNSDGTIPQVFRDRLRDLGSWLRVNGESIYSSRPWTVCQNETDVFYTTRESTIYAILTEWPQNSILRLNCPVARPGSTIEMLGVPNSVSLLLHQDNGGVEVQLPLLTPDIIPCQHAWVLRVRNPAVQSR